MPGYTALSGYIDSDRKRTSDNLLRLRKDLRARLPVRTNHSTLLLATWNLRDFDSNKFGHGPRLPESIHYIAEILSAFDLVAVQEVSTDLAGLERVMAILGPTWDYIATDRTEGSSGNLERMVFIFDRRKVRFNKIASGIVLPQTRLIGGELQFARTPFLVSFQSGWFKFSLCAVHLYYGASSGEKLQRRIEEIHRVSEHLAKRAAEDESNIILLGDFNIVHPEHETMKALTKNGFVVPPELQDTTNMDRNKYYDQIAFMLRENELQLGESQPNAGVYDYYQVLYKPGTYKTYYQLAENKDKWEADEKGEPLDVTGRKAYFKHTWRTFQMSDHLPLWVELKIDFSDAYLRAI
ncbi:MAG TPA: endonuclease/exonuclease/phosphatase family protein [Anaerolineales bacterium]|nr:endonuclease/exonuclease/phosphatase family protein [Anaerolineales bacterium]